MSLLSHDRYQYDSLILSKQTWAYPQHLQRLLWCVVSVRLNLPVVEERKLCPIRYYANCVSTTLTVLILHNVESVYFFYSNPVFLVSVFDTRCLLTPSTLGIFVIKTEIVQLVIRDRKLVWCCCWLLAVVKRKERTTVMLAALHFVVPYHLYSGSAYRHQTGESCACG